MSHWELQLFVYAASEQREHEMSTLQEKCRSYRHNITDESLRGTISVGDESYGG